MSTAGNSSPLESPESERIAFGGVFASRETELAFRLRQQGYDTILAYWCLGVTVLSNIWFALSDYRFFGSTDFGQFLTLLTGRALWVLTCFLVMAALSRGPKPIVFDLMVVAWAICGGLLNAYVESTRPPGYLGHIMIGAFIVVLTYCVLPVPLRLQIIPALIYSVSGVFFYWHTNLSENHGPVMFSAILQAYVLANLLGFVTSLVSQRRRRQLFLAMAQQTELRGSLEQALAEIKTLRGILAICAHCKRVQNENGSWEEVEVYVRKHTHAEFSHDICPECAKTLYPKYS